MKQNNNLIFKQGFKPMLKESLKSGIFFGIGFLAILFTRALVAVAVSSLTTYTSSQIFC
ncbi:MAG: hypothetical protein SFU98_04580 [Leptospiraceae bacterium]|nr:hypothetical protein [Leptospiraceae bacterium]